MIDRLKELLRESLGVDQEDRAEAPAHDLRLATAALLLEMARADRQETEEERRAAGEVLARHFALEREAAEALLTRAESRVEHSVSLYEFTRVLNETLAPAERREIVRLVAEVAASDGRFDPHEQHLLSKLADLLHLRRAEYATIRASVLHSTDALE
jgi:uncharacterized tellurite resistance protein B-like protein